jgi:hypothetical protein
MSATRRRFLRNSAGIGLGLGTALKRVAATTDPLPPVRPLTRGPRFHWFGYYDKLQFDPTGRYALGMEVTFEHRLPTAAEPVRVGMVDTADGDRWIDLGASNAWCWQQGCMLQWLPGSDREIIWNDRAQGQFISRILDAKTGRFRALSWPIYAVSPDGKRGVGCSFSRIWDVRPGYGYPGIPDPDRDDPRPSGSGVYTVDLRTGEQRLLVSVAQVLKFGKPFPDWGRAKHYFIHLLYSPDGKRIIFLHRWRTPEKHAGTRMFTVGADGTDLRLVDANGMTSHFIWRDERQILAWSNQPSRGARFYLFDDRGEQPPEPIGADVMQTDGHCTYLPGNRWILNDTYPDKQRLQHPYLYEVATGRRVPLGHFHSPPQYTGEWRVDTHPRSSPDGKRVVIDSPHVGPGRQMYLIDIAGFVA